MKISLVHLELTSSNLAVSRRCLPCSSGFSSSRMPWPRSYPPNRLPLRIACDFPLTRLYLRGLKSLLASYSTRLGSTKRWTVQNCGSEAWTGYRGAKVEGA